MYNNVALSAGAGVGAGALAMTGSNFVWLGLAAFALIAAGSAVLLIIPRRSCEA